MRPVPFSADAMIFELRDGRVSTKRANLTRAAHAPATPDSLPICHCRCVAICMNQTMEVERGLSNLPVPGVVPFRAAGRAAAAALRGGVRRVGVVADHRNAGERLHDQLLDGRRHVAAAGAGARARRWLRCRLITRRSSYFEKAVARSYPRGRGPRAVIRSKTAAERSLCVILHDIIGGNGE